MSDYFCIDIFGNYTVFAGVSVPRIAGKFSLDLDFRAAGALPYQQVN